jgi:hypothetical protein
MFGRSMRMRCSQCGSKRIVWQFLRALFIYRYFCRECPHTWQVAWIPPTGK